MPKIDARYVRLVMCVVPFGVGRVFLVVSLWWRTSGPSVGFEHADVLFMLSGVGGGYASTESLILAQDERWRRA